MKVLEIVDGGPVQFGMLLKIALGDRGPEPKKELGGASDIIEYKKKAKLESLITECLD